VIYNKNGFFLDKCACRILEASSFSQAPRQHFNYSPIAFYQIIQISFYNFLLFYEDI